MFYCKECGNEYKKWYGKCPACKQYNTMIEMEDLVDKTSNNKNISVEINNLYVGKLKEVKIEQEHIISTGISELDRVLGGGIIEGSLTLLGGAPGVGKSTLTLQLCDGISQNHKVIYISGEESASQIKLRTNRILKNISENFLVSNTKNIEQIQKIALKYKAKLLIIDSIQTIHTLNNQSMSGSVAQLKECTLKLMYFAKEHGIAVTVIGHITKDGEIAGPKLLEHMVDTVLYLEGEKNTNYKILRSKKNRFGKVGEVGIFEMGKRGLLSVQNINRLHMQGEEYIEGIAYSLIYEGDRPLVIEIQSLVVPTAFGYPKRTTQGYNLQRINLLLGLIQKRLNLEFNSIDCYLNLSIYLHTNSYDLDLAVIASLISSKTSNKLSKKNLYLGEVSLTGEIKKVDRQIERIKEAKNQGFVNIYCNIDDGDSVDIEGCTIHNLNNIQELLKDIEN